MKKFLFTISAGVFCCLVSCNNNQQGDKNLAAENAINKAIETGDVSKLGDYIAVDAVDHAGEMGDVKGLDSIKANLARINMMVTDMKSETLKEFADADHVIQWMKFTGTCKVAMGPSMPAGSKYEMTAIEVSKFKDGKAVEHWEYMDPKDIMKMMGNAGNTQNTMNGMNNVEIDSVRKMDTGK